MEEHLARRVERAVSALERMRLDEYVEYVSDRRRLLWRHFLCGAARGLGFSLGVSVPGAVLLALLRRVMLENIPLIGGFLAEVIDAIEKNR